MSEDNKEIVVDNSQVETSEPTATETPETAALSPELENGGRPVETLTQAKEVFKARSEAKAKAKEKTESKPKNDDTDYRQRFEEIQKAHGKTTRELGELRKRDKEYQQMLDAYNAAKQKQEDAALREQYKENPEVVMKELARREAAAQTTSLQEEVLSLQAQNTNSYLVSNLGAEYDTHAPVMADIIREAQELDKAKGSNWAEQIARSPQTLIQLAKEKMAWIKGQSQKQVGDKKKAENLRVAGQIATTSNNRGSQPVDDFKDLSLAEMTAQLRKAGIIKK